MSTEGFHENVFHVLVSGCYVQLIEINQSFYSHSKYIISYIIPLHLELFRTRLYIKFAYTYQIHSNALF